MKKFEVLSIATGKRRAMYRISKEFHFSASHQLKGLPSTHQCARIHGHNYILKIVLEGDVLDEVGFVLDYGALDGVKQFVDKRMDHRCLGCNERTSQLHVHTSEFVEDWPENPTSENICHFLFEYFKPQYPALTEIQLSETPKTWATYRGV